MAGRPTSYREEFCEQLTTHMEEGFSFESFAGVCRCNQDTLYEWAKVHPEFSEAKKIGFQLSRLTWERIGKDIAKSNEGNSTAFIFNMKNRFPQEWRDKIEREDTVKMAIEWKEEKTYEAKPETNQGY